MILVRLTYELTGLVIRVAQLHAVPSLLNRLVGLAALALIMELIMPRLRKS